MSQEKKIKVSCRIPEHLMKHIETAGYKTPTEATVAAYKAFTLFPELEKQLNEAQIKIKTYEERLDEAQRQIKTYEEKLKIAPSSIEFATLRVYSENLHKIIEEKDKRIEELNKEVENLISFNNYLMSKKAKVRV